MKSELDKMPFGWAFVEGRRSPQTAALIMLSSEGRPFRAEASISQAELPTMRECGEMVGYIVKAGPDKVGAPVPDLRPDNKKV